jgi:hypothetical protein
LADETQGFSLSGQRVGPVEKALRRGVPIWFLRGRARRRTGNDL